MAYNRKRVTNVLGAAKFRNHCSVADESTTRVIITASRGLSLEADSPSISCTDPNFVTLSNPSRSVA
jgi:hypothetical protein